MNEKLELLKDLIEISEITPQIKLNVLIQTLLKTDIIMKAQMLSDKILNGDFSGLKENQIDNLIVAFSKNNIKEVKEESAITEDIKQDNQSQNLEYQIKVLQSQMESIEYNNVKKLKELEDKNNKLEEANSKLIQKLSITVNTELITISDEDINELYIKYLESGTIEYKEAFIIGNVIPKSYYKIKE